MDLTGDLGDAFFLAYGSPVIPACSGHSRLYSLKNVRYIYLINAAHQLSTSPFVLWINAPEDLHFVT
jgi:hypothetical protein